MRLERTVRALGSLAIMGLAVSSAHAGDDALGVRASLNPLHAIEKASLKSFAEKPLFDPARRLPPPPMAALFVQPVSAPPEPPPNIHLLGIIQGQIDLAIVGEDGDMKTQMLSSGDHIGAWEVTVLPSMGLQLRLGARVVDYALFNSGNAASASVEPGGFEVPVPPPSPTMAERNARLQRRTY